MSTRTQDLKALDRATILHPFTQLRPFSSGELGGPWIISGGEGIRVRDRDGQELIDAFAGRYCVHVGYGRREIADAIHRQALELPYFHSYAGFSNEPAIRLAERVLRMAPARMQRVFYGLSGSDSNETQMKIVWYYNNVLGRPLKKKIISRWRGYHGGTVMSGSLTGLENQHQAFDLPQGPVLHTITPHFFWHAEPGMSERDFSRVCAARLEALIQTEGPDTVAAFIGEPVLGTGGIIPPPEGYWEEIQQVLRRYDVLLIADEVVCGFGRLGKAFGAQCFRIEPDLITVGKGITSGYLREGLERVGAGLGQVRAVQSRLHIRCASVVCDGGAGQPGNSRARANLPACGRHRALLPRAAPADVLRAPAHRRSAWRGIAGSDRARGGSVEPRAIRSGEEGGLADRHRLPRGGGDRPFASSWGHHRVRSAAHRHAR
jgi:L-2,4-diaminobutyrate transaminase